jgi:hypothetical protein
MSSTESRRWRTVVAVAAAAVALTAAGPLPAALAYVAPSPSMTANHGAVNIAVQGPNHSLLFYWATNGTATWHTETIAGAGSTFSAPSMAVNGNTVNVAALGPHNTLTFYWAFDGTATWHPETVAGGVNRSSTPSMAVDGNTFYVTASRGFGELWVWTKVIGVGAWQGQVIGQHEFAYFPAITANGNTVDIAVANQYGGALDLYSAAKGSATWHKQTLAGPGSTLIVPPSIAVNHGSLTIAAVGGTVNQSRLIFYWAASGSSTWHPETVAGGVSNSAGPSITSNVNAANISDINSAGDLEFYWAADGTATWHAEFVPGNGTGPHL